MNFVAIDFETASSERSSVCSMGIVKIENGQATERLSWLIRPPVLHFNPYNTYIHGITADDVKDMPQFNELWDTIKGYLEGNFIIAHNASFDISVLRSILDNYSLEYPKLDYHCSWIISKKVWPELLNHKLNMLANHLGVPFKHHDAAEDAFAASQIIVEACKIHGVESVYELSDKLSTTIGHLFPGSYIPASVGGISKKVKPKKVVPITSKF